MNKLAPTKTDRECGDEAAKDLVETAQKLLDAKQAMQENLKIISESSVDWRRRSAFGITWDLIDMSPWD